jgi:hypothetical protein
VSITELAFALHVPAILAFFRAIPGQHASSLLLFVIGIVQGRRIAPNGLYGYPVQGRMVTAIV